MNYLEHDDVIIRPFEHRDRKAVEEFFSSLGAETIALFDRRGTNKKNALAFIDTPTKSRAYFLAELNGEMLGCVFFYENDTKIPCLGIVVSDKAQGLHLGTRLMQYAIAYAKKAGKGGIYLTTLFCNLRGQILYENCGFEYMGQYKTSKEYLYLLRFKEE